MCIQTDYTACEVVSFGCESYGKEHIFHLELWVFEPPLESRCVWEEDTFVKTQKVALPAAIAVGVGVALVFSLWPSDSKDEANSPVPSMPKVAPAPPTTLAPVVLDAPPMCAFSAGDSRTYEFEQSSSTTIDLAAMMDSLRQSGSPSKKTYTAKTSFEATFRVVSKHPTKPHYFMGFRLHDVEMLINEEPAELPKDLEANMVLVEMGALQDQEHRVPQRLKP